MRKFNQNTFMRKLHNIVNSFSYLPVRDLIPEFLRLALNSGFNWRKSSPRASWSRFGLPQGSEERVRCLMRTPLAKRRGRGRVVTGGGGMFGKPLRPQPPHRNSALVISSTCFEMCM